MITWICVKQLTLDTLKQTIQTWDTFKQSNQILLNNLAAIRINKYWVEVKSYFNKFCWIIWLNILSGSGNRLTISAETCISHGYS